MTFYSTSSLLRAAAQKEEMEKKEIEGDDFSAKSEDAVDISVAENK